MSVSEPAGRSEQPRLRLLTGDAQPSDAGETYRRYAPYVAAVAYRLLGRDEDVDDAVQEVFVRAIRGFDGLQDRGAIKGWLAAITVRVVARKLRLRRALRVLRIEADYDYDRVAGSGADPEQAALLSTLYGALDDLAVPLRTAWLLRHVDGQTLPEVAEHCACSLATAKRRIDAADTWLKGRVRHG